MIKKFNPEDLKKLYTPPSGSHKGQNGKLLIIGGSHLFHAASLWALTVATRIADMVFYSSVPENNEIVQNAKEEFRNGIIVPRSKIDAYIDEADCVLIGPGLPRPDGIEDGDDDTRQLTERLLTKFPDKKWVVDGGSLQAIRPQVLPKNAIITPHAKEFRILFSSVIPDLIRNPEEILNQVQDDMVAEMAKKFGVIILLKGEADVACSPDKCVEISGGNAGMTKGGTGDVLAGLVAALACKNDLFIAACSGSYINKKAGEELFKKVGYYFNASDLTDQIPKTMKELLV